MDTALCDTMPINFVVTDDVTRSFCGKCRSRSDCTECSV